MGKRIIVSMYLVLVFTVLASCTSKAKFGEPTTIYVTDDKGTEYPVIAVSGQAIVFFAKSQSGDVQKQIIKDCGGKIIEQIPAINYYLVKTSKDKETEFIEKIKSYKEVDDAYVNEVSGSNSTTIDIIDDFTNPNWTGYVHGVYVEKTAKDVCPNCIFSNIHNVKNDFSYAGVIKKIHAIFTGNTDITKPILINMSFGDLLYRMKKEASGKYNFIKEKNKNGYQDYVAVKWEERAGYPDNELWQAEREDWVRRYKGSLLRLAQWLAKDYAEREFIVTKGAGNNGCHELDTYILQPLLSELYQKQFANEKILKMLNERIILVSARDDILYDGTTREKTNADWWRINGEYADRPKKNQRWVTTLDISQLKYPDQHSIDGTSFSAPLLLGHIARLFAEYDFRPDKSDATQGITLKEMVALIQKLTADDANKKGQPGLLDIDVLNQRVKNLHLDFTGVWEMVYLRGMLGCTYCYTQRINANLHNTECRCEIEFFKDGRFRQTGITETGETKVDEGTYVYEGKMDYTNYMYLKYAGFNREAIFGDVGEFQVVGNIRMNYKDYYSTKYIKVLDRPIPTPNGKSAFLEVDDHRTPGCTMWFGKKK